MKDYKMHIYDVCDEFHNCHGKWILLEPMKSRGIFQCDLLINTFEIPDHVSGYLFSYPNEFTSDILDQLGDQEPLLRSGGTIGPLLIRFYIIMSDIDEKTTKSSSDAVIDFSRDYTVGFELPNPILKTKMSATLKETGKLSSLKFNAGTNSVSKTLTIEINSGGFIQKGRKAPELPMDHPYHIQCLSYWDPSGVIRLLWITNHKDMLWVEINEKPDPALVLSYYRPGIEPLFPFVQHLSYGISIRKVGTESNTYKVDGLIYNWSGLNAYNVPVNIFARSFAAKDARNYFKKGLPNFQRMKSLHHQSISRILGRDKVKISAEIEVNSVSDILQVFVVINLKNKYLEHEKFNNFGFQTYPRYEDLRLS